MLTIGEALGDAMEGSAGYTRYQADPVGFVRDILDEEPWSRERSIMESVQANRQTFVLSCHEAGKSYTASRLVAWWLSVWPAGEAFAVTTAPTFPQVRAILWREIAKAHRAGDLPGRLNQTEWWRDEELVGFGRKPSVAQSDLASDGFQGIHARRVLVVIDEAAGVPSGLFDAAFGLIGNEASRLLAIGHPDDPTSAFARKASGGNRITISAFDTPNFTGERVDPRVGEELVSQIWVDERRADWGEGSPLWASRVLGRFPDSAEDSLIPLAWAQAAADRTIEPTEDGTRVLSVDVARFGSDKTIVGLLEHDTFTILKKLAKSSTTEVSGTVRRAALDLEGVTETRIDTVGVGGGVADELRDDPEPACGRIIDMEAGSAALDPSRFANARAEWWWTLRTRLEEGTLVIPDDPVLLGQLTGMRYRVNSRGRIVIESKEEMRKRGLPSPDEGDALVMAVASASRALSGSLGV